jgi:hypothetical protein
MPILSGSAKVQGYTRGGECWRWYARGVARHCRPQGANGIERHCRAHAATLLGQRGPVRAAQGPSGGCKKRPQPNQGGRIGILDQAIYQPWPASSRDKACRNHGQPAIGTISRFLTSGRAKTTSVIDAITRRAKPEAGLPVLILKIPNNPILQSCALPDYNCGATLISAQDCAYTFCHLTKPAARRIAGLRCSPYRRTAALLDRHCFRSLRFCKIPSFLHRIRI